MRKMSTLVILAVLLGSAAEANAPKQISAKCFKADTVAIWEKMYCFVTTGADDDRAEAFQNCHKKVRRDESLPKERCERVIWLKNKACSDDPSSGNTRKACLTDKDYLKKIEKHPPYLGS